jgi:GNAT superfamily N-acetyltransferase
MPNAIHFRPAEHGDYPFALNLYLTTMRPLTAELMAWNEEKQIASFQRQWQPEEVRIIQYSGRDVGWMQAHVTSSEVLLQQLFVAPAQQRRGIGSAALEQLVDEWDSRGQACDTYRTSRQSGASAL